jgi:hypothetical protein
MFERPGTACHRWISLCQLEALQVRDASDRVCCKSTLHFPARHVLRCDGVTCNDTASSVGEIVWPSWIWRMLLPCATACYSMNNLEHNEVISGKGRLMCSVLKGRLTLADSKGPRTDRGSIPAYLPDYLHMYVHTYLRTYVLIHTYMHAHIHTSAARPLTEQAPRADPARQAMSAGKRRSRQSAALVLRTSRAGGGRGGSYSCLRTWMASRRFTESSVMTWFGSDCDS